MIRYIKEDVDFSRFDDSYFGKDWIEHVPKECIKGATLLSSEEYEEYENNIPNKHSYWWLRSAGRRGYHARYVGYEGYIENGFVAEQNIFGYRPSLILSLQSSNCKPGDKFEFDGLLFTIISNDLAICDDIIKKGCFRKEWQAEDANDYEKSDVKQYVEDWFNKAYNEYE